MSADQQFVLAKALYDNDAETTDELAFSKGDILTVQEFFPNGLDGWWLCSLRNKVGICPGNRLQLLGHVQSVGNQCCNQRTSGGSSRATSPAPPRHHVRQASDPLRSLPTTLTALSLSPSSDASTPCRVDSRRRLSNSNKVIIPQKVGEVYLYDIPDSIKTPISSQQTTVASDSLSSNYSVPTGHPDSQVGTLFFSPSATYDTPRPHRTLPMTSSSTSLDVYDVPKASPSQFSGGGEESYDVPRSYYSSRRSSAAASEFPTPLQDYDVPRSQQFNTNEDTATYDVPVFAVQPCSGGEITYDVPPSSMQTRFSCASLSSTSSSSSPAQSADPSLTPSLSLSSLGGGCGGSSGSNRSSLEKPHELYDIPKPAIGATETQSSFIGNQNVDCVYDVPPQVTRDPSPFKMDATDESGMDGEVTLSTINPVEGKEIALELDAAVEVSVKLQQEVQSAINKLFTLLGRSTSTEDSSYDLQLCCCRVRTTLQEFLEFANGALVNSSKSVDQAVCARLNKLLRPLQDANVIVRQTCDAIENDKTNSSWDGPPDDKDRLVACARTVIEDVRQVSCFIQGNSTLIFKRATVTKAKSPLGNNQLMSSEVERGSLPLKTKERPLPPTPASRVNDKLKNIADENLYENDGGTWVVDDYDYVNLESKESYHRKNEQIKASLPKEMHKSFDNLLKESLVQVDTSVKGGDVVGIAPTSDDHQQRDQRRRLPGDVCGTVRTIRLDVNDRHVVSFYAVQLDEHANYLSNAIQAFLTTVEKNQPPKVFVDHGKFVILGAHKLVFIGDTIHRNVFQAEVRTRVQRCADDLCETLKTMVQRIKVAAQQFPSVLAVQEMVDSVVDVSQAANELKTIVINLARM